MSNKNQTQKVERFFEEMKETFTTKNKDYATDEDMLANFRQAAKDLGLPMRQVWAVYAAKHWQAIIKWCREGQVDSEPIRGRLIDIANYAVLGALIDEVEDCPITHDEEKPSLDDRLINAAREG